MFGRWACKFLILTVIVLMKLDLAFEIQHDSSMTMEWLDKTDRDSLLLRPAVLVERRKVYNWLVASEATRSIMGPPYFPEYPVPGWEKFCTDYSEHFFLPEGDGYGRVFILCARGREIGYIGYFGLNNWRGLAELEICIASSSDCGQGLGPRAIRELADKLLEYSTVEGVVARPSRRNRRAVTAFRKAGFIHYDSLVHELPTWIFSVGLYYRDGEILLRSRDSFVKSD